MGVISGAFFVLGICTHLAGNGNFGALLGNQQACAVYSDIRGSFRWFID